MKTKILVFAHTPPPHHGQSVMVENMLRGLRKDSRFEIFHVNASVSDALSDVGSFRPWKLVRLFRFCAEALIIRLRHGPMAFYYVPAPAKLSAVIRDILVMTLCRPFFTQLILHWHAYGLGQWVKPIDQPAYGNWNTIALKKLIAQLLANADLSIAIGNAGKSDASLLLPKKIDIVANGIDDPCPSFNQDIFPLREAQRQNRAKRNSQTKGKPSEKLISNFLFLAHCTEAKGLFDALESLKLGNKRLEEVGQAFRMRLTVAGEFVNPQEKCRFNQLLDNEKLGDFVNYVGFVSGQSKKELLTYSECLLCPTHWDNFPTTILEAMAFDLPVIVSDCGSLPDMFPKGYGWICRTHSISDLTNKMIEFSKSSGHLNFRDYYLENFSSEVFIRKISESILSCSQS